ncbi:hypothetical protein DPMN_088130 [Dreissena polymorpha]|uniref:Uncharacterized protein n=1 Tax=Dreissena polymorpha TaxID=45954 RepID=A0A9D4KTK4_DREPO|nr:hypothetical protein DPMN_088130 [Dreissena polymorpha]
MEMRFPNALESEKNTRNLERNVQKLRKEIVAVLVNHNIAAVEQSDYDKHSNDVIGDKDCLNDEISLGIRVDDGVCPCLQDFVNFSCDSAIELNATLEKELQPRAFGFYEEDFDMSRVPGADIDRLKIGELISNRYSELVFYSFYTVKSVKLDMINIAEDAGNVARCNSGIATRATFARIRVRYDNFVGI